MLECYQCESLLRENASLLKKLKEAQSIAADLMSRCWMGKHPDKAQEAKVSSWIVEVLDA